MAAKEERVMETRRQTALHGLRSGRKRRWSRRSVRAFFWGLFFTAPTLIGWCWLVIYPVLASLYYSFTAYSAFGAPKWIGLLNYTALLKDDNIWVSLYNSVYFVVLSIPLGIVVAMILALLLNMNVGGMSFYRTLFYLPSIVPAVASAVVWSYVFNPQYGVLNNLLRIFGINGPGWLLSPVWSKPALVIMSVWGAGNLMIVFLAGLQDVPQELYDAARVDGATWWPQFRHVTIPFLSPHLLFAVITGLIGGFQYFTQAYVITSGRGGPARSTLMYALYLYQNAFRFFKMGYASAMAWVLLVIVVILTALVFRTLAARVY